MVSVLFYIRKDNGKEISPKCISAYLREMTLLKTSIFGYYVVKMFFNKQKIFISS